MYEHVAKDIINSAFCGINGTIFCYGQTASGKTHTCLGTNIDDEVSKGFVPRIIETVLTKNRNCPLNIDSRAKLSIVEIYNENVTDLLNMSHRRLKLR